ncbi:hypothetical protein JCM1393_25060 [Clostridium carnis]
MDNIFKDSQEIKEIATILSALTNEEKREVKGLIKGLAIGVKLSKNKPNNKIN